MYLRDMCLGGGGTTEAARRVTDPARQPAGGSPPLPWGGPCRISVQVIAFIVIGRL